MTKISNRKAGIFSSIIEKSLIEVWLLGFGYCLEIEIWSLGFPACPGYGDLSGGESPDDLPSPTSSIALNVGTVKRVRRLP
jgi:hypothetical protein